MSEPAAMHDQEVRIASHSSSDRTIAMPQKTTSGRTANMTGSHVNVASVPGTQASHPRHWGGVTVCRELGLPYGVSVRHARPRR